VKTRTVAAHDDNQPLGAAYWRLWTSASVSSVGDGLVAVGFPLVAVTLSHSPIAVAAVAFATRLPWLVIGPFSGVLADRVHRGRLLVLADLLRAALLGMVVLLLSAGMLSIPVLCVTGFVLGAFETLFVAGAHAGVPSLVAPDQLDRANARLVAAQHAGEQMLGPVLGALAFAAFTAAPFAGDALSFVVSGIVLLSIRRHLPAPQPAHDHRETVRHDLREGVEFLTRHPMLRLLAGLICGLAFAQALVTGVLVLYCVEVLHLSPAGYGLFIGITASGNVVGAMAAPRVKAHLDPAGAITSAALISGVVLLVAARTSNIALAAACFFLEACAVGVASVVNASLRQTAIPNALLGRVGNLFRSLIWGAIPAGMLVGGVLADAMGLRAPLFVAGCLQLVVAAVSADRLAAVLTSPQRALRARRLAVPVVGGVSR
jgi:predicted MFS family arabinose efflux permease